VENNKIISFSLLVSMLIGLLSLSACTSTSTGENTGGFNWTAIMMVIALLALSYFFIIRPMKKRQSEQRKLLALLKPGDHVITGGGIYGEIESLAEDSLVIKVESGAKLRVTKYGLMVKR